MKEKQKYDIKKERKDIRKKKGMENKSLEKGRQTIWKKGQQTGRGCGENERRKEIKKCRNKQMKNWCVYYLFP